MPSQTVQYGAGCDGGQQTSPKREGREGTELDGSACFSEDIESARRRFLAACDRIGLRITSYRGNTPDGDPTLFCDVTRLGSPDAKSVAVLCSAAAGPAGLIGCGIALGVVEAGGLRDLPRDVALVLVHAANPGGPIWNQPPLPPQLPGGTTDLPHSPGHAIDWSILRDKPITAMAPGLWDVDVLKEIAATRLARVEKLCVIDTRAGHGPFGDVRVISADPDPSAARTRGERWFAPGLGKPKDDEPSQLTPCGGGLSANLTGVRATNVVLEFGTRRTADVLFEGRDARRAALSSYPTDPVWRTNAWRCARQTLQQAYKGLQSDT